MDDRELSQRLTNIETLALRNLELLEELGSSLKEKRKERIKNTESKTDQNLNIEINKK